MVRQASSERHGIGCVFRSRFAMDQNPDNKRTSSLTEEEEEGEEEEEERRCIDETCERYSNSLSEEELKKQQRFLFAIANAYCARRMCGCLVVMCIQR